jgi:hypothetical protein
MCTTASHTYSHKEKLEDGEVAHLAHAFILELAGSRWSVVARFQYSFPWVCATLIDPDPARVDEALKNMSFWWERLQQLDEQARHSEDAKEFRASCLWPLWDWPRSILIVLSEHDFKKVN